jgi:2-oxoglutarate dehydrogenase E2 component (dihydrolipoamide succinyltransferase)
MSIEIKVPVLPESIADATVAVWHKQPGDFVSQDENIVDLETDKVVLEVPAPADGVLKEIFKPEGSTVLASEVIASFEEGAAAGDVEAPAAQEVLAEQAPAAAASSTDHLSPAPRQLAAENDVAAADVSGTGKKGRVVKQDVEKAIASKASAPAKAAAPATSIVGERVEKRVPMTRLRQRIAERLLDAKNNTAMLTTFNEVNLQEVMDLRKKYKELFEKKHDSRLGFMSFFTKAAVAALKQFPSVNASIDGSDVVYHGYYDIGVAMSTERGLVVPILRDADQLTMAGMESSIVDFAKRAKAGKLSLEDMTGGTFSITNGGVFGSMLSTPILNPPQSAILGMHTIQQRVVVENGEMVIRPMMYLALSYDHRIIDGKEAISFLVAIKNILEDPARLLLEV